jgi:checkpoint serine/threonine-protein kinase
VDWGRAIDLVQYSFDPEDGGRNVAFIGTAAQKEMQCVSMRSQGKWSFDADTFGILCSAHVLLFGEHMDIKKGKGNKWKTKSTFKRYWQQDLWHEIFDALLNPRDMDRAFGSRSSSLRSLWRKIDSFLKEDPRQEKLRCLLARQAKLLPDSREKI